MRVKRGEDLYGCHMASLLLYFNFYLAIKFVIFRESTSSFTKSPLVEFRYAYRLLTGRLFTSPSLMKDSLRIASSSTPRRMESSYWLKKTTILTSGTLVRSIKS